MTTNTPPNTVTREAIVPDTCCFTTTKPFSRRSVLYNCKACAIYILLLIYTILLVLSLILEAYIYQNNNYSKTERILIVNILFVLVEIVVIPAIIVSCIINKIIWPIIVFNIIFILLHVALVLGIIADN